MGRETAVLCPQSFHFPPLRNPLYVACFIRVCLNGNSQRKWDCLWKGLWDPLKGEFILCTPSLCLLSVSSGFSDYLVISFSPFEITGFFFFLIKKSKVTNYCILSQNLVEQIFFLNLNWENLLESQITMSITNQSPVSEEEWGLERAAPFPQGCRWLMSMLPCLVLRPLHSDLSQSWSTERAKARFFFSTFPTCKGCWVSG